MKNKIDIHSPNGAGLMGFVRCTYQNLTVLLGEPNVAPSLDGKVRAEWEYDSFAGVFTIYDYKESCPVEDVTVWHIGGHSRNILAIAKYRLAGCGAVTDRDGNVVGSSPLRGGPDAYVKSLGE